MVMGDGDGADGPPDLSDWAAPGAAGDAAPGGLEPGGVYRDEGDDDSPAVDFVVGRIEAEPTVEGAEVLWIAHVQIGPAGGGDGVVMSHAPIELQTALEATSGKAGTADVGPGFEEGYGAWREAFEAGEAGAFSLSPARVYALTLQALGPAARPNGRESVDGGDA